MARMPKEWTAAVSRDTPPTMLGNMIAGSTANQFVYPLIQSNFHYLQIKSMEQVNNNNDIKDLGKTVHSITIFNTNKCNVRKLILLFPNSVGRV